MTSKIKMKNQQRMKEIEDRKIEILLEIAGINNDFNEKVSRLKSEYAQLHEEYYHLQLKLIKKMDDII
jgi:hypothetical protein